MSKWITADNESVNLDHFWLVHVEKPEKGTAILKCEGPGGFSKPIRSPALVEAVMKELGLEVKK